MIGLSFSKLEKTYCLASKLFKHYKNENFDLLAELSQEAITQNVDSPVDSIAISCKYSLRLDAAVPARLHFNHILFLSVLLLENNSCRCSDICASCAFNKLSKCSQLSHSAPWGGVIGPGLTLKTHYFFSSVMSLLKVHAVFHDAYGHLYRTEGKGPGYTYALPKTFLPNHFWLGHITGVLFLFWLKLRNIASFRTFEKSLK